MRSHCKNHRIAHSRSGHCCRRKNSFDNSFSIFMPTVIAIHLLVFFVMLSLFLFMRTKWSDDDDDDTSNRLDNMQMHILISLWWNMENDSAHNLILMSASIFVILAALTIYRMLLCWYATVFPPFSHCTLTTFFIIKYSERDDEGQASKIRETQQKKYSLHSAHAHAQSPQANRRGRRSFTLCRNRITKVSSPHPEHCRSAFTHKFIGVWRTNSR